MKRCGGHWNRQYVIRSDSEETETTQGRMDNAGLGWALKKGQDSDRQEGLGGSAGPQGKGGGSAQACSESQSACSPEGQLVAFKIEMAAGGQLGPPLNFRAV